MPRVVRTLNIPGRDRCVWQMNEVAIDLHERNHILMNTKASCILLLGIAAGDVLGQDRLTAWNTQPGYNYQADYVATWPSSYGVVYAVDAFVNLYNDVKEEQRAKEEAQSKLAVVKQTYASFNLYPDSVMSGWHNVVVTDNLRFCRDAKVLVKGNRIEEFAIDDCFPVSFTNTGKIKNARTVLTLNKFNGEQLEIVDVYFLYDLEQPQLVSPPVRPGYVTFWTRKNSYLNHDIILDTTTYDGVTQTFKTEPACDQPGTVTIMLKPGTYSLRAMKSGNDLEGKVEIKSNQCLLYLLD